MHQKGQDLLTEDLIQVYVSIIVEIAIHLENKVRLEANEKLFCTVNVCSNDFCLLVGTVMRKLVISYK